MPRMRGTVILLAAAAVYGLYGHYVGVHAGDTDGTCDATGGSTSCGMPSVLERGLLQRTPSYDSILQEEKQYGSDVLTKRFHGDTLGYVTPWNNHGYNTAKLFRSKFTYIAPVWYQIRHNDKRKPALTGGHDVDLEWMTAVRGDDTSGPQIVPRFMFEMNSLSPQEAERIISLIRSEVKDQRFDGITLEIPVLGVTVEFITSLGQALQSDGCILILVLPTSQRNDFIRVVSQRVLPSVHRLSVNAYDYSTTGPNSPLPWLKATLEALKPFQNNAKFLMGLAFYGYDTNEAIVASKYRELLDAHHPAIEWDDSAHECYFRYPVKHIVYYPCLQSIQDRLDLYLSAQTGAAIWDIGQGLDYFFDLL
ncbi:hypothetical protein, variant 1 [Aphanomyces astaci]|uniref:Chitinase domain-containing protein 1 n=1 Tax=Aphanomyces astaci TaxID=112090 RepID=W4G1F2_APHAT|nr:hypothetical protein, variant 1 [Aphanomyces astaci]ETV72879.1 hypothetical protein, variant 1 [Aphanomyces astaci]|eukprot:XP_009837668.1 hypothetical protein, variant 1 [Aphanomyces astaci]